MVLMFPATARRPRRPVALGLIVTSFFFALAALAPGAASAATHSINKTIQPTSPKGDRPARFGRSASQCGQIQAYSGNAGDGPFYPAETSTFVAQQSGCLTVDQPGALCAAYLVLYDAGLYDRLDAGRGYLADSSSSADIGAQSFGYTVEAGKSYTLAFIDANRSGVACQTSATLSGPILSGTDLVQSSNNANLSNLTLSSGALEPVFSPATTSYTATVPRSRTSISVTPTVADSTATVTINGSSVASGSSSNVPLGIGTNTVTIVVTAQDGSKKIYTVAVSRDGGKALLASVTGTGRGSVTSNPTDINCFSTTATLPQDGCTATFDTGTQVTLTATPRSGSTFGGFSGGAYTTLSATTCRTTLSQTRMITATFLAQTTISAEDSLEGNGALRATVRRIDDQAGVAGQTVTFRSVDDGSVLCTATTNQAGQASCSSDASRILAQQPNRGYRATTTGNGTVSSTSNTATLANFTGGGRLGT